MDGFVSTAGDGYSSLDLGQGFFDALAAVPPVVFGVGVEGDGKGSAGCGQPAALMGKCA